jgi:addiction module HigA family antidote
MTRRGRSYRPAVPGSPGELIRERLFRRGRTQAWLAEQTGLSVKHVSQLLTGRVTLTAPVAVAIATALRISARRLMMMQVEYDLHYARAVLAEKELA